jgi:hypothetical protein
MTAPPSAAMATVIIVSNNRWRMMMSSVAYPILAYPILASRGHGWHIACAQCTDRRNCVMERSKM